MSGITPPKLILGDLPAIERRLAEDIDSIQAGQPLVPVTILVDNVMLIPYLRKQLAFYDTGHINLHIMTPANLAEKLGRDRLLEYYGRSTVEPMPEFGDRVLARRIAEETNTEYFGPVSGSPGFAETLRQLFREFAQAGVRPNNLRRAIRHLRDDGTSKLADIVQLYERFEKGRHGYFTPQDTYHHIDLKWFNGEHLLVYGIWQATGNQRKLFEQMMRGGVDASFYMPATDSEADDAHADLRSWLRGFEVQEERLPESPAEDSSLAHVQRMIFREPDGCAPHDGKVRLLSAPDAPREVREAARTLLAWADEGIPFHRMAVVYRQTERYRTLIDQIFQRAGIATYLHSGRPMIEQPRGQRILGLLNLVDTDLNRSAVMEFLTETILPKATRDRFGDGDRPIHPARWDQLSREAGIIEGRDQWLSRLDYLYEVKLQFTEDEDEDRNARREREAREILRLRRFIEAFSNDLARAKSYGTWSEHLAFLQRAGSRYIEGVEELLDRLSILEELDRLDHEVPFERFRELVRYWLSRQDSSDLIANGNDRQSGNKVREPGEFARYGVNVMDVRSLRHLRYDAVIVLGVAERQFPPPSRQDPLLLDRERGRLNENQGWCLPLKAQRADDEALTFAVALQAANKRLMISYPRSEAGSVRSYLPSHFFREAATALTGEPVEASRIDRLPKEFYTRIPAGSFKMPDGQLALDYHEYDRALLEHDPDLGVEVCRYERDTMPRAIAAYEARRGAQLTQYDGFLSPEVASPISMTAGLRRRAISPSRLETYATCPYQFFLRYGLRLEPVDEPEMLERINALDRGSLIHKVLEEFLKRLGPDDPPSADRREAHLESLFEIAEGVCDELERQGLVGYRMLWEFDRIEMFEDLEEWYEHEIEDQAMTALRPTTFELRFGPAWEPSEGGTGSRDEPYTVHIDGNELSFQGRVDRVDITADRSRFRVIDYKTGRAGDRYRENEVSGGRALQLPIYLLATAELLGLPWQRSEAEYFFVTRRGDYKRISMTGTWLEENWETFTSLLSSLSESIESGMFMQVPEIDKPRQDNCRNCDFESVCTANVKSLARRKRSDPRATQFRRLIEADGE